MDTKLKADIAESAVKTELLKRGFQVMVPIGDRLPYDLALDQNGKLTKIQIKSAWKRRNVFMVDSRRTRTNRLVMKRAPYQKGDFDFAVIYIQEKESYYIMPFIEFATFKSEITLESSRECCKTRMYKNAWHLLKV